jgi:chromosome segregation ATPase
MNTTIDHWISVADTLKQQRDQAEKERDAMKARAEAAEAEAKVLREVSIKFNRIGWTMLEALGDVTAEDEVKECNSSEVADRFIAQRDDAVSQLADYTQEVLHLRSERDSLGERLTAATKRAQRAEAERDALRKDAARLDWLESEKVFRASVYYLVERRPRWVLEATDVTEGATLREAVDAAMEATP